MFEMYYFTNQEDCKSFKKVPAEYFYDENGQIKDDNSFAKGEYDINNLYRYIIKVNSFSDIIDVYEVFVRTYYESMGLSAVLGMRDKLAGRESVLKPYLKDKKFQDIIKIETDYLTSNCFFNWDIMPTSLAMSDGSSNNIHGYLFWEPTTGMSNYISEGTFKFLKDFYEIEGLQES